ncbi:SsrA-binding protein SmpB [Prochlorothrix hollandica]|uniref:SsrA-binding protein n=1 Tax=Prochlorothrix hollandica PCC 9006 = CALU 1027 TaxID=317619 RepID=A0A0M2PVN9_PROHO|nr:SsrA-binding protein SmpB [Prochlorothrix hollandica]KKI99162.1 single-stranded DNA-binding protein [Prochlorothrix hollandica PCC 9006 = CALU 1027]
MADKNTGSGHKLISDNRHARFQYEITDTYEAGISLLGTEVKSIRAGRINMRDGFALVRNGEIWLHNVHISPYNHSGSHFNHEPLRTRKLLLHREEIRKLLGKLEQKGLTLVPLKMYFKNGRVKVVVGLGKGKKLHDKRETLKKQQDTREMARVMKQF